MGDRRQPKGLPVHTEGTTSRPRSAQYATGKPSHTWCAPYEPPRQVVVPAHSEDAVSIIGEDDETVYLASKANLRDITRTES